MNARVHALVLSWNHMTAALLFSSTELIIIYVFYWVVVTLWPLKPVKKMGVNEKTSTYFLIPEINLQINGFRPTTHSVYPAQVTGPGISKSNSQNNPKFILAMRGGQLRGES